MKKALLRNPCILIFRCFSVLFAAGFLFNAFAQTFDSIPAPQPITQPNSRPVYAPIWSPLYELSGNSLFSNSQSQYVETSLYEPYNDFTRGWWDNIIEEFTYAGISNTMVLTRASVTEGRQWDTLKTNLIPAMKRAGIYGNIKFGQFEDCGAWAGCYKSITGNSTIDWSDTITMTKIFWDYCVKRFHDFMPKDLWFRYNGEPVWMGWGSGGTNYSGNVSKVLREVKRRFKATYGEDLFMIIDQVWKKSDPTITGAEADAYDSWFCCGKAGTFSVWNNYNIGVCVPGFQDYNSDGTPAAYGADFDRDHGNKLRQYFDSSITRKANIVIEEGYVDMREGAGAYRSPAWDYPSQYLEIIREFNDTCTVTRRLQAEACDSFYNKTFSNASIIYSRRKLNVGELPGPNCGWYVGPTNSGDWLLWKHVFFANGSYDGYVRYASNNASQIVLSIGSEKDTAPLSSTSGSFQGKEIFSSKAISDTTDVKIEFLASGINLDFLQVNKSGLSSKIAIPASQVQQSTGFSIRQYVNSVAVRYFVPWNNAATRIQLYDPAGRILATMGSSGLAKGDYECAWRIGKTLPGLYIARMLVSGQGREERCTTVIMR